MSEINPYAAPTSSLVNPSTEPGGFVPNGRAVEAGQGFQWVMDGFRLFFRVPAHFYMFITVHVIAMLVSGFVPILGPIIGHLAMPMFMAGYFAIGHELKATANPDVSVMFTGFNKRPSQLLAVGGVAALGLIASAAVGVVIVIGPIGFSAPHVGFEGAPRLEDLLRVVVGALVATAMMIPVTMATWFAPALILFHDIAPVDAMKQSFNACLKNFVPYLVYGVVGFGVMIVGAIPIFLGWFVVIPALAASLYPQYVSIFAVNDKT